MTRTKNNINNRNIKVNNNETTKWQNEEQFERQHKKCWDYYENHIWKRYQMGSYPRYPRVKNIRPDINTLSFSLSLRVFASLYSIEKQLSYSRNITIIWQKVTIIWILIWMQRIYNKCKRDMSWKSNEC